MLEVGLVPFPAKQLLLVQGYSEHKSWEGVLGSMDGPLGLLAARYLQCALEQPGPPYMGLVEPPWVFLPEAKEQPACWWFVAMAPEPMVE